jgi:hypothetical protein
MPRQISDDEYMYLQGKRQVADFVENIYNNPQLNKEAKRLIKKAYPQVQIPDLDIEDRVEERLAGIERERNEAEAAKRQAQDNEEWQGRRKKTQSDYGFTDEAMKDLEQFMVDRNIGDYEVAAAYKAQRDPKPSEAQFDSFKWNHEKTPGWAEIAKDPEEWGRNEILQAIRKDQAREKGRSW